MLRVLIFFVFLFIENQLFNLSNLIIMKAFEIIQLLSKGFVPVEKCGTSVFRTSDLSELSSLFGKHYSWIGHMFKGDVFYAYNCKTDDWTLDDADLIGQSLEDENKQIFVFQVGD